MAFRFDSRITSLQYDGNTIPFCPEDYSLSVIPTPNGAYPAIITRGKRGPTRIGTKVLTDKQQVEMKLWSAQ
jgi:hypothetical protein